MLRPEHQQQVAAILHDPEASENDKYVALQFLRNSEIAAKGVLPTCQDTGTAIIMGKKGQRVWTGGGDEAALSKGVFNTYIEDNLRYSQNAPLDMYKEVNTGSNLPAQIDLYAVDGDEYKFLCVAKGGGSANKTYLYQETKALLTPGKLKNFLVEKMRTLGTAACPPYHIAFVIGGTSAESTLKTVNSPALTITTRCRRKVTSTARHSAISTWNRNCWKKRKNLASAPSSAGNISPTIFA
ncbi:fumarase B [Salmonella enterica subsp. arizonae]|uniref:Fumarase B n=1 Tax=Salmonella enterica subsp. arizonae TaxID=59203 RepID=A0A447RAW3_SALER|nr:fumarase B [Salmonella enterica subsp. arizonae]